MSEVRKAVLTGGCQCGAVRYALYAEPRDPHVCHCRMCQKAFGSVFAPLASVDLADLAWTRDAPGVFRSSTVAERGFCRACGTPLSFRYLDTKRIAISLGSLDEPARITPRRAYGLEGKVAWADALATLPGKRTEDDMAADRFARLESHQHPDHDTPAWRAPDARERG